MFLAKIFPFSDVTIVNDMAKFEIRTLSINPTLKGWGQPFDTKDCIRFLHSTRAKFDDVELTLRITFAFCVLLGESLMM